MYLHELNWDNVPADVSVLLDENDQELNFVKNLREYPSPPCKYEGDECDVSGEVFSDNEGWYSNWSLLERPVKQQTANVMPISYHIAEWLEKWGVVYNKCPDVGGFDFDHSDNIMVTTDFGSIRGAANVVDFVNTRYAELKAKEANERKAELAAKRLKVLQELSDIDQELGRY